MIITQQQQRIQALELEVENIRPKKRVKVAKDPNECFIQIWEGSQDQGDVAVDVETDDGSETSDNDVEELSCIVVKI